MRSEAGTHILNSLTMILLTGLFIYDRINNPFIADFTTSHFRSPAFLGFFLSSRIILSTCTQLAECTRTSPSLFPTKVANALAKYHEDSTEQRQENKLDCD